LDHPDLAERTCEECCRWFYDTKTGRRSTSGGRPRPRPPGLLPSCFTCPKVANLPPAERNPKAGARQTLSPKNWLALEFYYRARASRQVVSDPLAAANCGLIERVLDGYDRQQRRAVLLLAGLAGGRK
jgi:hypothetical protein